MNYSDPSGHGIKSKLKKAWGKVKSTASNAWNKVKSTASNAWSSVKKTASNIYNKARTGLNNYMNSDTYKGYFDRAKSSGGGGWTGASTGNGYVGRNSGSGNVSGVGAGYRYYGGGSGVGINVSGTLGIWTYDGSLGVSVDAKGNIGIQYSYAGGVTVSSEPSLAIAVYETATNAPDIYTLEGDGASAGGAVVSSVSGIPVFVSGDVVIVGDVNNKDKHYYGVTGAVGVGTPEGGEMHIEISGTKTVWSTNIKELF